MAPSTVVLLDMMVLLVSVIAGVVTSRFQSPRDEEPTGRVRLAAYAGAGAIILLLLLHISALASLLPRVPMASLYLPLGFVLGYIVHRVLIEGVHPSREESVLLAGLGIGGVAIVNVWLIVRVLVA